MRAVLLLGTKKGIFLAEHDAARDTWEVRGPLTSGTWSMYHVGWDGAAICAGGASNWYGPAVWRSDDLGQTWTHSSEGLTYAGGDVPDAGETTVPDGDSEVTQVWCVTRAHGVLYAGVEPAGLFKSTDDGATWQQVAGLRAHPSRPNWRPTSGGLALHTILAHPTDPRQLWAGISSGGIFHTDDGGATWHQEGTDLHPCVHALALAPPHGAASTNGHIGNGSVRLYQQSHNGVYRSDDGGAHWLDVSVGLPARFGFPLAVHPHDPQTLFVVPLESDAPGRRHVPNGQMTVWRSRDGGAHWQALTSGFPEERALHSVLRGALTVGDPGSADQPASVYLGTTTGQVYSSADEGDTWRALPARLPPIYSIAARLA